MTSLAFFLPPLPAEAGGGNRTDRALIAALRQAGHAVSLHEVGDAASLARACAGLATGVVPVLDGMVLRHATTDGAPAEALDGRAVALVHHLAALTAPASREQVREAERQVLARMRRVVATSAPVAARLAAEYGLPAELVRTVPPGMAVLPRSVGSGGPGCVVLSVGRLAPRKGHDRLLRALALLTDLDWRLDVAGDGFAEPGYAESLRALAAGLGVTPRLQLHVAPDAASLEALWAGADVFALASLRETTGAAVAEALRRGLPVAVTAAGELVPDAAGCVCLPEDQPTLSKSLRRMIFDTALRAEMAEAAWQAGQALPGWPLQATAFLDAIM